MKKKVQDRICWKTSNHLEKTTYVTNPNVSIKMKDPKRQNQL